MSGSDIADFQDQNADNRRQAAISPTGGFNPMNIVPVITIFGGLAAFFTLAVALRFAAVRTQVPAKPSDN
tara:strand:- start:247 stop:456 length:210 start_codon:yes stop_codon:yes gene_type:complete